MSPSCRVRVRLVIASMCLLPAVAAAGELHAVEIAVANGHNCARLADGTVRCWGCNGSGQLGNGSLEDSSVPTVVRGLDGVVSVAVAAGRSCALRVDGSAWCWGNGYSPPHGELDRVTLPHRLYLPGRAVALAVHGERTCALMVDGRVFCRGEILNPDWNPTRIIGDPTRMPGVDHAVQLVIASGHPCVLDDQGQVLCWFRARRRSHVIEPTSDELDRAQPLPAERFAGFDGHGPIQRLEVLYRFLCARFADGTRRCVDHEPESPPPWGRRPGEPRPYVPTPAPDLEVGGRCLRTADGHVRCYALGPADELTKTTTTVEGLDRVKQVVGHSDHACALRENQTVWCWGSARYGALGDGLQLQSRIPLRVKGLSDVVQLSAGSDKTCALRAGGQALCWGYATAAITNDARKCVGEACGSAPRQPAPLVGVGAVSRVFAGGDQTCVLLSDGTARCAGASVRPDRKIAPWATFRGTDGKPLRGITWIDGDSSLTASVGDASLWTWSDGPNRYALRAEREHLPSPVRGFSTSGRSWILLVGRRLWEHAGFHAFEQDVIEITGTVRRNMLEWMCVRLADSSLRCAVVGDHRTLRESVKVVFHAPAGLDRAEQVVAGRNHFCARDRDGGVWCWGSNPYGQLGDGTVTDREEPVRVTGLPRAVEIAAGEGHSCARVEDGGVFCWGDNGLGELGIGGQAERRSPVQVGDGDP